MGSWEGSFWSYTHGRVSRLPSVLGPKTLSTQASLLRLEIQKINYRCIRLLLKVYLLFLCSSPVRGLGLCQFIINRLVYKSPICGFWKESSLANSTEISLTYRTETLRNVNDPGGSSITGNSIRGNTCERF